MTRVLNSMPDINRGGGLRPARTPLPPTLGPLWSTNETAVLHLTAFPDPSAASTNLTPVPFGTSKVVLNITTPLPSGARGAATPTISTAERARLRRLLAPTVREVVLVCTIAPLGAAPLSSAATRPAKRSWASTVGAVGGLRRRQTTGSGAAAGADTRTPLALALYEFLGVAVFQARVTLVDFLFALGGDRLFDARRETIHGVPAWVISTVASAVDDQLEWNVARAGAAGVRAGAREAAMRNWECVSAEVYRGRVGQRVWVEETAEQ